jgi:hypothetical protein
MSGDQSSLRRDFGIAVDGVPTKYVSEQAHLPLPL